ncbi:geraniol 8-hydroxylase-like isoform X1 [Vicia villosa]|uniref:geraniol 8-hydroxylase-like isoform X1 n=1 Tax=Vicia villosa TaxID=3911 RepID=UPI00273B5F4C|nr:geraniol 8-hydroxylase-like isoform X1 [Vicia villosa]
MEFLLSSMILLFLFPFTLYFLLSKCTKNIIKLPPGPTPLPFIGNLHQLGKKPHKSLAKLAETHGPLMTLKLGQVTTIVVSSPNMAKEVLQTHDHILSNRTVPGAVKVHDHDKYNMAFLPIAPLWRELRKICNNELFSNKTLDESKGTRLQKLEDCLNDINQSSLVKKAVNIEDLVFKTSINLLSNTIFSVDLVQSSDSVGDFKELILNILKECGKPNIADLFPALNIFNFDLQGIKRRNAVYAQKVFDIFRRLIDQRVKLREVQRFDTKSDMLSNLLDIAEDNSQEMNKAKIPHLSLTLFIAGTDTISSTLEWAMSELVKNEKIMTKAKQELEQIIGKGKPVEETDIVKLPYLQAIIKETFRLHPAVPFLVPRKADANVEIDGYTIPKDAQIWVNVWAIGRNSSTWENANLFSPERFLESKIDAIGHNFELLPFGAGRRICPGISLATKMLPLMLGSFINCFNWKLEDGMKVEDMNMEDKFGLSLEKSQPLRVVPEKVCN